MRILSIKLCNYRTYYQIFFWFIISQSFSLPFALQAQESFWKPSDKAGRIIKSDRIPDIPELDKGSIFELNLDGLRSFAQPAAKEANGTKQQSIILSLPKPNGNFIDFYAYETQLMEPALARKYPEIKTYYLKGLTDPMARGTITMSPDGVGAYFTSKKLKYSVYISKVSKTDNKLYISYWSKDHQPNADPWECDFENYDEINKEDQGALKSSGVNNTGDFLRIFRMAVGIPGALSQEQGWTTKAQALAALVSFMAQINLIYERDLSVRFVLVANEDDIIFLDDATDPYVTIGKPWINGESQKIFDDIIGSENYDLGMSLVIGSCCSAGSGICGGKGRNNSRYLSLNTTAHEIGHQFGMNHTWTACGPSNNGQFGTNEYGSGTTIMSYANLCNVDNILPTYDRDYFGVYSRIQATNKINSNSCYKTQASSNSIPVVTVPASGFYIPINTPFELNGSATDADNDSLTYSWEQTNIRGVDFTAGISIQDVPQASDGNIPIQRLFNPKSHGKRIIPQLPELLANISNINERLPSYDRNMKYSLFVRDNRLGCGGTAHDEVSFEVDETAGPFLVTAPNSCVSWTAGTSQTITWDVANTTNANVNAQNVNILLSLDGGYTWPHTLASATTNDGTESVTLPSSICSNNCRIRVEADGNIFFDLSDEDFVIGDGSTAVVASNAVSLGGTYEHVDLPDAVYFNGDFTIEAWVYVRNIQNWARLLDFGNGSANDNILFAISNGTSGQPAIRVYDGASSSGPTATEAIPTNQWTHIAATVSSTTAKIYINGVEKGSGSINVPNNVTRVINYIGRSNWGGDQLANALFDDIRIWDVARTETEIQNNMNCTLAGTETNLLVYFPMNPSNCEGCGISAEFIEDKTSNNYHGRLVDGAHLVMSSADVEECPTCTAGAVSITTNPGNQSVAIGATANFSAAGTGTNLSYQWAESADGSTFNELEGETTSSLDISAQIFHDGYLYRCYLGNGCEIDTTTSATLNISCSTPTIGSIMGETAPCENYPYVYHVIPDDEVLSWNWTYPAGWSVTESDNLIFVQPDGSSGTVSVYGIDACGTNTNTQNLSVTPVLIQITSHPTSQTVAEDAAVNFSASVASGGGTNIYQWQRSADGGNSFNDINGETSSSYNIASASLIHDGQQFRCLITNDCLIDTTNIATLTVNCGTSSPSTPTQILGPTLVCNSSSIVYNVDEVPGATSYTWTLPSGWTGSSSTNSITVTTTATGGVLKVNASNSCGTSNDRQLEIVVNNVTCKNALHFDGINDHLSIAQNSQDVDGDMSMSLWIRPDNVSGLKFLVFNGFEYNMYIDGDHIGFQHYTNNGSSVAKTFSDSGTEILPNRWQHVAITRDVTNLELKFFLDGILKQTHTWDIDDPANPDDNQHYNMKIGGGVNSSSQYYEGYLDELKIWDDERTDAEIADDMYCTPTGSESNLLAYYGFEQGQPSGNNVAITSFTNSATAYPDASINNLSMTGAKSNVVDGGKVLPIDGIDFVCSASGNLTYSIDLPGSPTVTWTLPSGWTGSSTSESIVVTPNSNGGLLAADATLSCGNIRLEKSIQSTPQLVNPTNTRSLDFDGTDDYLELPSGDIVLNNSSITIELWAKRNTSGTDDYLVIQGSSSTNTKIHVGFRSNNTFTFAFYSNDLNTDLSYIDDEWHHWACVYDQSIADPADNRFIYRDGELVASDRTTSDFLGSGSTLIGVNNSDYFDGRLDELRIWNVAKSQAEIQQNYYCTIDCPPSSLLLYLPMEEGVIDGNNSGLLNITDYSSYAQDVSIKNFAMSGTSSNIVAKSDRLRYLDSDSDGYGDVSTASSDFCLVGNYVFVPHDCNDSDNTIHPYADEVCANSVDDNCDGDTDGETNKALHFDNTDDHFSIPVLQHTEFFTVEAWVKVSGDSGNREIVVWEGGSSYAVFRIWTDGDGRLAYGEGGSYNLCGSDLRDGNWHHVAVVHDGYAGNNIRLYVDGNQLCSFPRGNVITGTTDVTIGANSSGGSNLDGAIDDVRFWNVALTTEQIQSRMELRLDGDEANLERYYTFDHGTAGSDNNGLNIGLDKTINAAHGTLYDFDLTGSTSNWVAGRNYPTIYQDSDNDGYGGSTTWTCGTMDGYEMQNYDCNDSDNTVHPYGTEICGNSMDEDCDGNIDVEVNKALHFDGSDNSRVSLPLLPHTEFFTVEAWINLPNNLEHDILVRWDGSPYADFRLWDNNKIAYVEDGFGNYGGPDLGDDMWHHVALVHDGYGSNNIRIYVDGDHVVTATRNAVITATALTIGATSSGGSEFSGSIDDVRFWDVVLTQQQIQQKMFYRLEGTEANLVRYYTFDHGKPGDNNLDLTTAIDRTSNDAHGTLLDFSLNGSTSNWVNGKTYSTLYLDSDSDGFGGSTTWTCGSTQAYKLQNFDCNDSDNAIHPYANEICGNSIDDDCDGNTDLEINKALDFDITTANFLPIPIVDFTGDFSVEYWIKPTSDNGINNVLRVQGASGNWEVGTWDRQGGFLSDNSGWRVGPTMDDGNWHHMVLTYNSSTDNVRLYIDGNQELSATRDINYDAVEMSIGSDTGGGRKYDGSLDEIRFWDYLMSTEEISERQLVRLVGNETDLLRYYSFDHGFPVSDNTDIIIVKDKTAMGNDATMENFVLSGSRSNWVAGDSYVNRYLDNDGDTFGSTTTWSCGSIAGYVTNTNDCDDSDAMINPYSKETCGNSVDDNCDTVTDTESNKALDFDGTDDYLDLPDGVYFNGDFTVEAWVYLNAQQSWARLIDFGNGAPSDNIVIALSNSSSGNPLLEIHNGGSNPEITSSQTLPTGQWTHLAYTLSGTTGKIYMNGVETASGTLEVPANIVRTNNYIGKSNWSDPYANAVYDEIRIWGVARTKLEILENMNRRLDGTETGLEVYFPMDIGDPGNANDGVILAKDRTSGGKDGVLNNFALSGSGSNWVSGRAYNTFYQDGDSDGFGGSTTWSCGSMSNYIEDNSDCDDADNMKNPAAQDVCGNGVDENCNGVVDDNTYALNFDGTDDEVNLGNGFGNFGTGDFTIEIQVKTTEPDPIALLTKTPSCGTAHFFQLALNTGGSIGFIMSEDFSGNFTALNGGANLNDGNWHHVSVVRASGESKLFVDGNLEDSWDGAVTDLSTNTVDWLVGNDPCSSYDDFNGDIDELRFWNIARSQSDLNLFKDAELSGSTANLVAYYDFNHPDVQHNMDNSAYTSLPDRTGNGYTGTLSNFSLSGTSSNWVGNPEVTTWYADADMDTYGDPGDVQVSCAQPTGYVSNNLDCDDTNNMIRPDMPEIDGNSIDDDCDGQIDEVASFSWVRQPNGASNRQSMTCTSTTDCCTQTFCYGLEFTPASTGTLLSYTTGFFVDCIAGSNPVSSNESCVMNDMSAETDGCASEGTVLINASGNTGSLSVTAGNTIIIHQICFSIPDNQSITMTEDPITDLSAAIEVEGVGVIVEYPDFTPETIEGNTAPQVTAGTIDPCYLTEAAAEAAAIAATTVMDDCDGAPMVTASTSGTCSATITVTATDECGTLMSSVMYNTRIDNSDPVVTGSMDATTVEGCDIGDVPAAVTTVAALEVLDADTDLDVSDVCTDDATLVVTSSDSNTGSCPIVVTRTYTITDECGNDVDVIHTININDTTAPTYTGSITQTTVEGCVVGDAPDAVTTVAALEGLTGDLAVMDNCTSDGNLTVSSSDSSTGTCPIVITRTYTVTDECSNVSADIVHTIHVDDTMVPTFTGSITQTTVEGCDVGDAPDAVTTVAALEGLTGDLAVMDNCTSDGNLTVSSSDSSTGTCPIVITRTYTVTDECSNVSADIVHTIHVDDTTAPAYTGSITQTTVEGCDVGDASDAVTTVTALEGLTGDLAVMDNCTSDGNLTVSSSDSSTGTCPIVITRTYTVTDECSNVSADIVHTIHVDDTTAPAVTGTLDVLNEEGCMATDASAAYTTVSELESAGLMVTDGCSADVNITVQHVGDSPSGTLCPSGFVVTRTYTVTDECGNVSGQFTQTINIDDTTAPAVTGTLDVLNEEGCMATDASAAYTTVSELESAGLMVTDGCSADVNITVQHVGDSPSGTLCPSGFVVTRTYTVTDECGNVSGQFTQTINIDDTTAPAVTGTLDVLNEEGCMATDASAAYTTVSELESAGLMVTDGCSADVNITVQHVGDSPSGTLCPSGFVVTRTYTVTDECGNVSGQFTQTINIDDTTAPAVTGTLDVLNEEGCMATDVPAAYTTVSELESAGLMVTDGCSADVNITVQHVGDSPSGTLCPSGFVVTRTYTVTDECGNVSGQFTQTINIDDTTAPAVTGTLDVLNEEGCMATDASAAYTTVSELESAGLMVTDGCSADVNITVQHVGDSPSGTLCPSGFVVTRTYTVTDECGNVSGQFTQTINIDDTTAPAVTGTLDVLNEEGCMATDVPAAYTTVSELESAGLMVTDGCSADVNITVQHVGDSPSGTLCPSGFVVTRTYTVTDECGNVSGQFTQTINIDDTTSPTYTGSITQTTIEGCVVGDAPDAVTTVAALEGLTGDLDVMDNCTSDANLTVSSSDSNTGTCPIVITRTYTVTDECGNVSNDIVHTIHIDDTTSPTYTGSITQTTVEGCVVGDAPDAVTTVAALEGLTGDLAVMDNCTSDGNLTVSSSDSSTGTCPIVITRTYTVTDECSNVSADIVHTIHVDDTMVPTFTGSITQTTVEGCDVGDAPDAVTTVAALEGLTGDLAVMDNCTSDGNLTVSSSDSSTGTCPIVITRTYTVTDECSNVSADIVHTIHVDDTTAPAVTGTLDVLNEEGCMATDASAAYTTVSELESAGLMVTDGCSADVNITVQHVGDSPSGTLCPSGFVVTRTYTVTDECGNVSGQFTQTINIDDTTAPAVTGTLDVLNEEGCMATDASAAYTTVSELESAGLMVTDGCSADVNITVQHVGDSPSGTLCPSGFVVTRTYTVTDECGNVSGQFTQTININDTTDPVLTMGSIASCYATESAAESAAIAATGGSDNCGGTVSYSASTSGSCPSTITVTGMDPCGNTATVQYMTIITNGIAPSEVGGPVSTGSTVQSSQDATPPTTLPVIQDVCGNTLTPTGPVQGGTYMDGDCEGTITYTYTYTDCAGTNYEWVYTYTIECGQLNLKLYMEGPYSVSGDTLTTDLNTNHLLPGQDKMLSQNVSVQLAAPYTPFGQPYSAAPWSYTGNAGDMWGDPSAPGAPGGVMPYPSHVVDWIYVQVRENGMEPGDKVHECAGWLHSDGSVSFPEDCGSFTINPANDYFIVVQHRNHLGILAEATVLGTNPNYYLELDFTQQDSYTPDVFRVGQKEISSGIWVMYSSNGEQINSIQSINSADHTVWAQDQNNLGYDPGDHNMNVTTNSEDETLWKNNQNKTSGVNFQ